MDAKENKFHYWINQLRRPLCFGVVVIIVFCYGFTAFAASYTFSDTVTYASRYSLDSSTSYPELTSSNINTYASANGFDTSVLTGGIWNRITGNNPSFNVSAWNSFLHNTIVFPQTLTADGIVYDIENAYTLVMQGQSWVPSCSGFLVWGSGNIGLVNNFIVSDQDFYYFYVTYYNSSGVSWGGSNGLVHVTQQQANGLYHFEFTSAMNSSDAIYFSDLSMYGSSSDGSSGFSTYSSSSTDFSFSNNNYDFNFLKTEFNVISPADPAPPIPPSQEEESAHHYLNFNLSTVYSGDNMQKLYQNMFFGWNENMIRHPEFYTIHVQPYITFETTYMQDEKLYTYERDNVVVTELTPLIDIKNFYGRLPSNLFKSWRMMDFYASTGGGASFRNDYNEFLQYVTQMDNSQIQQTGYNGTSPLGQFFYNIGVGISDFFGFGYDEGSKTVDNKVVLSSDVSQYCSKLRFDCDVWITSNDGQYSSRVNHSYYDFLTGKYGTSSNDNNINQYPIESGSDLPSSIISNGTGSSVAGGNNNTTVQVTIENVAREIMKPFTLNDEEVSAANVASTWNFMLHQLGDMNEENGFWQVIIKTYEMLPDEVTTMIYAAIAAILGCAVFRFYITCIRGA